MRACILHICVATFAQLVWRLSPKQCPWRISPAATFASTVWRLSPYMSRSLGSQKPRLAEAWARRSLDSQKRSLWPKSPHIFYIYTYLVLFLYIYIYIDIHTEMLQKLYIHLSIKLRIHITRKLGKLHKNTKKTNYTQLGITRNN